MASKRRIPDHGTRARYARGCRCTECREAARIYFKRMREKRLPARLLNSIGTRRKLQSLHAAGYTFADLGQRLGTSAEWPSLLANRPSPTVTLTTWDVIEALWQQLRHVPGPSVKARNSAAKRGWPLPSFWDGCDDIESPDLEMRVDVDATAVDLALKGKRVGLTYLERHYAVHAGHRRGMNFSAVAQALRMSATRVRELGHKPLPKDIEVAA